MTELDSVTFRAMGTDVRLTGAGAARVAREIERLEAMLTRFGDSPLSRLNDRSRLQRPPAELVAALHWAQRAASLSGGLVTPLVLRALEYHGYRRSWPDVDVPGAMAGPPPAVPGPDALMVRDDEVVLAPGAGVDLGGTAKSWIVEHAAAAFEGTFVVDAGGDVLLSMDRPTEVAIDGATEPWHLRLPPGTWGVATSSLVRRAWAGAHHLIDPRTGRPARSPWRQATVVARSLRAAEVAAKLVLFGAEIPAVLAVEGAWAVDGAGDVTRVMDVGGTVASAPLTREEGGIRDAGRYATGA